MESAKATKVRMRKAKWYEKYLPFVVRSPEMQIEWLHSIHKKKSLSLEEVTPYIRLLLMGEEEEDGLETLKKIFLKLDHELIEFMLEAADFYDTAKLFSLIPSATVREAVVALQKIPPPYERKPFIYLDIIYETIYKHSQELLETAAESLRQTDKVPDHFEDAYARFREILEDQKILSTLYPKAKG